jgi:hypothetical protein
MSKMILNNKWADIMEKKIRNGEPIDETISFLKATQWLIVALMKAKKPFKVYSLTSGVKRITTDTSVCPMCKRQLL